MERFTGYECGGSFNERQGIPYLKHRYLDEDGMPSVEYIYDQKSVGDTAIATFAQFEDTGLSPTQVTELLDLCRSVCNDCDHLENDCNIPIPDTNGHVCHFAKWKGFGVKDDE